MGYAEAFELQRAWQQQVAEGQAESRLFFVEHPPVLTLGANFHESNLLFTADEYREQGIEVAKTDRGGDVTYHGPGQLVAYPVFNLRHFGQDLHRWLRDLEEVFIRAIGEFGLEGRRFAPHTGVWVGDRKIAAIGVKVSKWVSIHGVALNCENDLSGFQTIIPCGIKGYGVTSLSAEVGKRVSIADAEPAVVRGFEAVFGVTIREGANCPS
jgi:lipoyl(octanoyl) transferase